MSSLHSLVVGSLLKPPQGRAGAAEDVDCAHWQQQLPAPRPLRLRTAMTFDHLAAAQPQH